MNCNDYQKQIISYLDGELHQDLANDFENHLTGCNSCKIESEKLKMVYNLIDTEKLEFKTDPFMSARVLAKIEYKKSKYSESKISLRYITITSLAAAGIAIGIIIGSIYTSNNSIDILSAQEWEQLADEYMPETDNNPYSLEISTNETPIKP